MSASVSTQAFRIGLADAVLEDLRARLRRTRRVRVLDRTGWDAGTDPDYLDALIRYWGADFDWRQRERNIVEAGAGLSLGVCYGRKFRFGRALGI